MSTLEQPLFLTFLDLALVKKPDLNTFTLTQKTSSPLNQREIEAVMQGGHLCKTQHLLNEADPNLRLSNPKYSHFFVEGGISIVNDQVFWAPIFNMEHDDGDALHGEETGLAQVRASIGAERMREETLVMSFLGGGKLVSCGGCRGFMLDNISSQSILTQVDLETENVTVRRLQDLTFNVEDLPVLDTVLLPKPIAQGVKNLNFNHFQDSDTWPYHDFSSEPNRKYTAMIRLDNTEVCASGFGPVDFRVIPPVQELTIKINDLFKKPEVITKLYDPTELCVYFMANQQGVIPRINYKDRNALVQLEHFLTKKLNMPLLQLPIAIISKNGEEVEVRLTNTTEIFPDPFHPRFLEN